MDAYKSNLLHAVTLMIASIWEYYSSLNPATIHLLPLFFGVIFLSLNNGVQYRLNGQMRATFVLTIVSLIFIGLYLGYSYKNISILSIFRYAAMIVSGIISFFYLLKSLKT